MGRRVRKKHIFFNLNWKKQRSGKKYEKAINSYVQLMKRQDRDGASKWLDNAFVKAKAKIAKYGISHEQILAVLERRGLSKLASFLS